jgi:hypothetical protein
MAAAVAMLVLAEAAWWLLDGQISLRFQSCCTFGGGVPPASEMRARLASAELALAAAHVPALAVGSLLLALRRLAAARAILLALQAVDLGLAVLLGVAVHAYGGWPNTLLWWFLALLPAAGLVLVWRLGPTAGRPASAPGSG